MIIHHDCQLICADSIGAVDYEVTEIFSAAELVVSEIVVGERYNTAVGNLKPPIETNGGGEASYSLLRMWPQMSREDGLGVILRMRSGESPLDIFSTQPTRVDRSYWRCQ